MLHLVAMHALSHEMDRPPRIHFRVPSKAMSGSESRTQPSAEQNSSTPRRLEKGDPAPQFSLTSDAQTHVSLSDYSGKKVLVYFYPRANTPGCTKEACDFRDNLSVLADAGIDVVGISPDSPEKLTKFKEKYELSFPLLSDPDKEVMKAWGAFGAKKNYGKLIHGVIRSTFVVGEDQTIELAKYNVRATGHVVRILKDLGLSSK